MGRGRPQPLVRQPQIGQYRFTPPSPIRASLLRRLDPGTPSRPLVHQLSGPGHVRQVGRCWSASTSSWPALFWGAQQFHNPGVGHHDWEHSHLLKEPMAGQGPDALVESYLNDVKQAIAPLKSKQRRASTSAFALTVENLRGAPRARPRSTLDGRRSLPRRDFRQQRSPCRVFRRSGVVVFHLELEALSFLAMSHGSSHSSPL